MHTPSKEEIDASDKKNDPERWINNMAQEIDTKIRQYNEYVKAHPGAEMIVAFMMTPEEREEFINGIQEANNQN